MTLAAFGIAGRLSGKLGVSPELAHQILLAILCAGLLAATVHLVVMLVTRWGERSPTWQAFIFSLVVHLTCGLGLLTVGLPAPEQPRLVEEEPIQIERVLLEEEETRPSDRPGGASPWESLPEPVGQNLSRVERPKPELPPLVPEREQVEADRLAEADVRDVEPLLEEPTVRPEPVELNAAMREVEAAPLPRLDEQTAEARPEVAAPTVSTVRLPHGPEGLLPPTPARRAARGTADVVSADTKFEPLTSSLPAPTDAVAHLRRRASSDRVVQSRMPAPSSLQESTVGQESEGGAGPAVGRTEASATFTRLRTKSVFGYEGEALPTLSAERAARPLEPSARRPVELGESVAALAPVHVPEPRLVEPTSSTARPGGTGKVPATYRLRQLARRSEVARQYGGTVESERAVELSLQWLARHQDPVGYWDPDGFVVHCPPDDVCGGLAGRIRIDSEGIDRMNAGLRADTGLTALALLAFLGAGYTPQEGRYADTVERALRWLVSQQQPDGFLGGSASRYARMYCHAMATYALAEAYGMQAGRAEAAWLRDPLVRAVRYTLDCQNPVDGGWRYVKGQRSDMSMFGWQLMALKSAEIAGLPIPEQSRRLLWKFLRERSLGRYGGLAAYRVTQPPLPPTPSMTAEALFCKQMLGISRTDPASMEAVAYLLQNLPRRSEWNLYYWYYGTLAMYQFGGEPWRRWNAALRDLLVAEQRKTGHAAGSWDPLPPWGPYGGRIYSTALATLCLEVYYRFLPLYRFAPQSSGR